MTKKKRVVSKLTLLVVLLTLISCCFLGSTFARYTTSGTGSAKVEVAEWNLSITGEGVGETEMSFDKLSPAKGAYKDTVRTHATGKILVATITNSGDVDALVTVTAGALAVKDEPAPNYSGDDASAAGITSAADVLAVFSIALYTGTDGTQDPVSGSYTAISGDLKLATNKTLYIYAEITWTSDVGDKTGEAADKRDTWIGENVTTIGCTLSYTAVQDSERPAQP